MTLTEARRIADDVLSKEHPTLELLGVTTAEGGSGYTEIIVGIRGCHAEPCQVVVGVNRDASAPELRREIDEQIRQHLHHDPE